MKMVECLLALVNFDILRVVMVVVDDEFYPGSFIILGCECACDCNCN